MFLCKCYICWKKRPKKVNNMDCPICDEPTIELPSGDSNIYRGCNFCECVWIQIDGSEVYRRMEDSEVLQKINGKYVLRDSTKGE